MSFLFNHIPNDDEGKLFIKQLRKYINRDLVKGVRARGRGARAKWEKKDQQNYQNPDMQEPAQTEKVTNSICEGGGGVRIQRNFRKSENRSREMKKINKMIII